MFTGYLSSQMCLPGKMRGTPGTSHPKIPLIFFRNFFSSFFARGAGRGQGGPMPLPGPQGRVASTIAALVIIIAAIELLLMPQRAYGRDPLRHLEDDGLHTCTIHTYMHASMYVYMQAL